MLSGHDENNRLRLIFVAFLDSHYLNFVFADGIDKCLALYELRLVFNSFNALKIRIEVSSCVGEAMSNTQNIFLINGRYTKAQSEVIPL